MMNPIAPGLRPMVNQSRSTLRFGLVVQPGDVLAVSDDVAGQLPVEFVDAGDPGTAASADSTVAIDEPKAPKARGAKKG